MRSTSLGSFASSLLRSRWAFCVGDEGDLDDGDDLEPAPPVYFVAGFGEEDLADSAEAGAAADEAEDFADADEAGGAADFVRFTVMLRNCSAFHSCGR